MEAIRYIFLLFLLLGFVWACHTPPKPKLDKPNDYTPVIEQVEKSPEMDASPKLREIKQNTSNALRECQAYGTEAYAKYTACDSDLQSIKKALEDQNKRIEELEKELAPWRKIKMFFWTVLIGSIVALIASIAWKFRKLFGSPV